MYIMKCLNIEIHYYMCFETINMITLKQLHIEMAPPGVRTFLLLRIMLSPEIH